MVEIISNTDKLNAFCAHASNKSWLTLDTEFIRERTYYPELCLIQIASDEQEALIDPLAKNIDLSSFWDILANPQIIKVLHAASQDLEIFYHLSPQPIHNIFDTQLAAMALGYGESIGYDRLVEDICDIRLDKSSRHTDWRLRPLTQKQQDYALHDVTWLRDIYLDIHERLQKLDRLDWIIDEINNQYAPSKFKPDPMNAYQRIKIRNAKSRHLVVLQELAAWREIEAKDRNRPRQYILRDDVLNDIAMLQPRNKAKLSHIRGISDKEASSPKGTIILSLIEKALSRPRETWPQAKKKPILSESTKTTMELLKTLLNVTAENNQLTPRLIANSDDIYKLATQKEEADIRGLQDWRNEIFGKKALALMDGKIGLALNKGRIQFVPVSFIH